MSKEENKAIQQKFGETVNSGNLEHLREFIAEDVKDHDPAPRQVPGPQGYIDFFNMMRTAFPDLKIKVEHLVADEDNVAFAYTITGTHKGEFMGIPPTDNSIEVRGM
ncbi:MAG TPA: ester cyclase, partial [Salinimicrobium sp.]|nr:ester cyclase [Salinimicrobium sp.]